MHKLLIEKAQTVFENKGGEYFASKGRLGDVVIGGKYSEEFVKQYAQLNEDVVVVSVKGVATPRTAREFLNEQRQLTRDEIVEKAKRDVAELVRRGIDIANIGGKEGNYTYRYQFYNVEFIVPKARNRVAALVRWGLPEKELTGVKERGIAKCAPDDCFNVHIGKAIALRRALGLEVPTEYLNAPQPTEVRVGDVIRSKSYGYVNTIVEVDDTWMRYDDGEYDLLHLIEDGIIKIIDDSRDGEASE